MSETVQTTKNHETLIYDQSGSLYFSHLKLLRIQSKVMIHFNKLHMH